MADRVTCSFLDNAILLAESFMHFGLSTWTRRMRRHGEGQKSPRYRLMQCSIKAVYLYIRHSTCTVYMYCSTWSASGAEITCPACRYCCGRGLSRDLPRCLARTTQRDCPHGGAPSSTERGGRIGGETKQVPSSLLSVLADPYPSLVDSGVCRHFCPGMIWHIWSGCPTRYEILIYSY